MKSSSLRLKADQFRAMMWKNWLFTIRRWPLTIVQLLSPLLFIVILLSMDRLPKAIMDNPYNPFPRVLDQPIHPIGQVQPCHSWNGQGCVTVRYGFSPAVTLRTPEAMPRLESLMALVAEESGLDFTRDFAPVESERALVEFVQSTPNVTTNALLFHSDLQSRWYSYTLYHNATDDFMTLLTPARNPDNRNELQIAVDRAILRFHNATVVHPGSDVAESRANISYSNQFFPQLGFMGGKKAIDDKGPVFFYCGIMFQAVIILYNICQEKDLKLRRGLKIIGLKDSSYWWSWILTGIIYCTIAIFVLIATGYAVGVKLFVNADFGVNFIIYFSFSLAILSLAVFTSVFIDKAKSSLNAGMLHFILGLLLVTIMTKVATKNALNDPDTTWAWVPELLSFLFPAYNLGEAICEVDVLVNEQDMYFSWSDMYVRRYKNRTVSLDPPTFKQVPMPTTNESLLRLLMNFVVFGVVGFYLDQVLNGPNGEPRPWYFIFDTSYWGLTSRHAERPSPADEDKKQKLNNLTSISDDEDNMEGESSTLLKKNNSDSSVWSDDCPVLRVLDLQKEFTTRDAFGSIKSRNRALKGVSFTASEDQVLAILGHNGAGKSTAINIITGLLKASSGEAYVDGYSVTSNLDIIRRQLGVCPQHDIVWDELTAEEHIQLIAIIKQVPKQSVPMIVQTLLTDVDLWKVRNSPVGTFSGGMKRRLSVAMSFVGSPRLVILDEPTTGMDPYVRRDIWNLILRMRKGRAIVMTTHSMEEADVLGDYVVIVSDGHVETKGTTIQLKNAYAGYRLSVTVKREMKLEALSIINAFVESSDVVAEKTASNGCINMTISLPPKRDEQLISLLEFIETQHRQTESNGKSEQIFESFNISQTSLEDVFLHVTMDAHSKEGTI